jgi:putative Mg2+ transporter-C (MgtC) family protein
MDAIHSDIYSASGHIAWPVLILRLAGAAMLAAIIGIEREVRKDTAGLRTNMMIALASATLALVALELTSGFRLEDSRIRMDPVRLVEAITSGVAFLAAGVVIFSKGTVRGLTTGAAMWLSGAIGLAAGLGYWRIAAVAAALGFIILTLLRIIETKSGLKS